MAGWAALQTDTLSFCSFARLMQPPLTFSALFSLAPAMLSSRVQPWLAQQSSTGALCCCQVARCDVGPNAGAPGQLTEGGTLAHTLQRLRASAALLTCSERLQRKYLRRVLAVFLSGSAAARVHAFLFARQLALALPDPALGTVLKARSWPMHGCPVRRTCLLGRLCTWLACVVINTLQRYHT